MKNPNQLNFPFIKISIDKEINNIDIEKEPKYICMIDKVFAKAVDHFKVINQFLIFYSVLKLVVGSFLLLINYSFIWMFFLLIHSIIDINYYKSLKMLSQNNQIIIEIGEKLFHTAMIPIKEYPYQMEPNINNMQSLTHTTYDYNNSDEEIHQQRKINILAIQIKYEVQLMNKKIKYIARFALVYYYILQVSGSPILHTFMAFVLTIGFYQYIQLYILLILGIILLPFYVFYLFLKFIFFKIKSIKFNHSLKPIKYNLALIDNQHDCRICMNTYQQGQNIIFLPCNQKHHFHQICIQAWLKQSISCPLCRKNFYND